MHNKYPLIFEVSKLTKKPPRRFIKFGEIPLTIVSNTDVTTHNCLHTDFAGSVFIVKDKGFDCGFWI